MKFEVAAVLFGLFGLAHANNGFKVSKTSGRYWPSSAKPAVTVYLPLDETTVYNIFQELAPIKGIKSSTTIAVSATQQVIWYDHWEDGEEPNLNKPENPTTQVWGDMDPENGCAPGVSPCTAETDILYQGEVIELENEVGIPRDASAIKFDAGDVLHSDYTFVVTRAAQATGVPSGKMYSGAIEVFDEKGIGWGNSFVAPVGEDFATYSNSFSMSKVMLYSTDNNNTVTVSNGETHELMMGQSVAISVNQGDTIKTDKNVLAHMCTGDKNDQDEVRMFSLLPVKALSTEYMAPAGDETGHMHLLLFNPGSKAVNTIFTTIGPDGKPKDVPLKLEPKQTTISPCVGACCDAPCPGDGKKLERSGAIIKAKGKSKFAAIAVSNVWKTEPPSSMAVSATDKAGAAFDWAYPLVPSGLLSTQVQVGRGHTCDGSKCPGGAASVLYVSPVKDADIYINTAHKETMADEDYQVFPASQLESVIVDTKSSAAFVFATKTGTGPNGKQVKLSAAWGRNPDVVAVANDELKMGTTIIPYPIGGGSRKGGSGRAKMGDTMKYEIVIENMGSMTYGPGEFSILDNLPSGLEFIEGSTQYSSFAGSKMQKLANDDGESIFQLDEGGFASLGTLPAHGGVHKIRYQAKVVGPFTETSFTNTADISFPNREDVMPLVKKTKLDFGEKINIETTVFEGNGGVEGCANAVDDLMVPPGTDVTYCLTVTNPGLANLNEIVLSSTDLPLSPDKYKIDFLEKKDGSGPSVFAVTGVAQEDHKPRVLVEGNPIFDGGEEMPIKNVQNSDDTTVGIYEPAVELVGKVEFGEKCTKKATKEVSGYVSQAYSYCLVVKNGGNSDLTGCEIVGQGVKAKEDDKVIAPGKSLTFPVASTKFEKAMEDALTLTCKPSKGTEPIKGLNPVKAIDSVSIKILESSSPTVAPTKAPTDGPTDTPTKAPTNGPTKAPTEGPTGSPTKAPTNGPTKAPTDGPTDSPTKAPTDGPTKAPTDGPTDSPTKAPTSAPTKAPTDGPTSAPTKAPTRPSIDGDLRNGDNNSGGGGGDPHFKTWTGIKYDFHGECDLVLLDNPSFANGTGMSIHIRTERERFFSKIKRAALRIGNEVLEFENRHEWLLNGKHTESRQNELFGYKVRRFHKAISVRLDDKAEKRSKIDFIMRKNGTPYIVVDGGSTELLRGSLGMIGDWETGLMKARDGETIITDPAEFAREWQVRGDIDGHIFIENRAPQYPAKCLMPKKLGPKRMGDKKLREQAELACQAWGADHAECVFDVMATGDITAAEDPVSFSGGAANHHHMVKTK